MLICLLVDRLLLGNCIIDQLFNVQSQENQLQKSKEASVRCYRFPHRFRSRRCDGNTKISCHLSHNYSSC